MKENNTSAIVSKVWSFCNPLRDIGVGYGDYLEQLTYLLFLKMADEFSKPPYDRKLPILKGLCQVCPAKVRRYHPYGKVFVIVPRLTL